MRDQFCVAGSPSEYRGYHIVPDRGCWYFVHRDRCSARDNRRGSCASPQACRDEIDARIEVGRDIPGDPEANNRG